jgi:hypothetical protein
VSLPKLLQTQGIKSREADQPISGKALRDGRILSTLDDARELISTLPPAAQVAERWLDAAEMLVRAEAAPSARDDALSVVLIALKTEGLI